VQFVKFTLLLLGAYTTPPAFCALALVVKVQSLNAMPDDWNRMAPPTDWLMLLTKLQPLTVIDGLFPS
jgi:hypothetical protein